MKELLAVRYPKRLKLKDGSEVMVRPMEKEDRERLLEFFKGVPEEDRVFLRDDMTRPEIVEVRIRAFQHDRLIPLLAEAEGRIVADATLHRRPSHWLRHVAEVHVVVDPEYRRLGLAHNLLYELFDLARLAGIETLLAEMIPEQEAAVMLFERLGFRKEATFSHLVKDLHERRHDMLIMIRDLTQAKKRAPRWFW